MSPSFLNEIEKGENLNLEDTNKDIAFFGFNEKSKSNDLYIYYFFDLPVKDLPKMLIRASNSTGIPYGEIKDLHHLFLKRCKVKDLLVIDAEYRMTEDGMQNNRSTVRYGLERTEALLSQYTYLDISYAARYKTPIYIPTANIIPKKEIETRIVKAAISGNLEAIKNIILLAKDIDK